MRSIFQRAGTALACACLGLTGAARADDFPSHPVKIVVPFAPGGGNDAFARLLAQGLSAAWKQQVFVENRPGAGGNIGSDFVAKSPADGYTLLLGHTGTLAINPSLYTKLSYDPQKDLAPISLIASTPLVLVVGPNEAANSVKELIAAAKARPGAYNFASSGSGTGSHLAGELFKNMAGVSITHVPYKGTSPAVTDLLGGQVQMMFSVIPTALPYVQAKRLKALAVTGAHPLPMLPGVPTASSSGLPGFESTLNYGVLAPKATPEPVIREIHDQTAKLVATAAFKERLATEGAEPVFGSSADFAALIKAETEKWRKVIVASGARAE
ncbi:MAG TPA: tripartite tricarboxylate transporter substrate binding protein [Burkholderiales bacterium]|jgi:tripartite-type tricarboxylate transporter receptor subunit TctC|nr:tripartite tricarboxylate transporter substrate binding protein [Burkholderiales bacterium]